MKTIKGSVIYGDNIEVMSSLKENYFDSCISDFPYNLKFMGKKWDTQSNFYGWCKLRAKELYRIIKPGGYVLIFGHPKSNHRMKSAFEDVGFNIVDEIDWIYASGFPKNQDISKMFDKDVGVKRNKILNPLANKQTGQQAGKGLSGSRQNNTYIEPIPISDLAKQWDGWKTSGLKPAHEPITVFQKSLKGKYIDNIKEYNCGAMNIDACRIPTSQEDKASPANEIGRFPSNIIFDNIMGQELDGQSGIRKSGTSNGNATIGENSHGNITPLKRGKLIPRNDIGGASRFFLNIDNDMLPFMYCSKASKKEKGEGNIHVTVKPKKLIKWLIKLVTPKNGTTIDITAGSGTHGLCCEELNNEENYNLEWLNVEMLNTEKEPYCNIAKNRINTYLKEVKKNE